MTRQRVYQQGVKPHLIKALHHEAKLRGVPMTILINDLLTKVLLTTRGMHLGCRRILPSASSTKNQVENKTTMAIKLVANYSKRLGLPGYSSHQFSVSVETELRDLAEADTEMSNLYHQLQRNVDAQIQQTGFVPSEAYGTQSNHRPPHQSNPQPRDEQPAQQDQWRCSEKQRSFIQRIMNEHQLQVSEVDHLARQRFGAPAFRLNKMQASGLIDALLDQHGPQGKGGSR